MLDLLISTSGYDYPEWKGVFGQLVLLCEAKWDTENGIGIQIYPTMEIGPQDTFL